MSHDIDPGQGDGAAELLTRARRALTPNAADQARVHQATISALLVQAAEPPGTSTGSEADLNEAGAAPEHLAGGALAGLSRPLTKLLSGVLIAAPAFAAGYLVGAQAGDRPTEGVTQVAPPAAPAPPAPGTAATEPVVIEAVREEEPSATDTAAQQARKPGARSKAPPERVGGSLEEELAMLRLAEAALRAGDPGRALRLLRELDEQVPRGALGEERRAAHATARCQLNVDAATRAVAEEFARTYPKSVYLKRVEQACGTE